MPNSTRSQLQGVEVISGLSHITFMVRDLDRMEVLLTSVFGAREVYESGEMIFALSKERFRCWRTLTSDHGRRSATFPHLQSYQSRPRIEGEGRSIYFHDYDDHLFELHTGTLDERLNRYARGRQNE
jgi:fosfomycin resistance protein FosX